MTERTPLVSESVNEMECDSCPDINVISIKLEQMHWTVKHTSTENSAFLENHLVFDDAKVVKLHSLQHRISLVVIVTQDFSISA
jgi:hypothetical protein